MRTINEIEKARVSLRQHRAKYYPKVDVIYGIWSAVHNSLVYVGSTTVTLNERKAKHKYNALRTQVHNDLCEAIREYGWDNFEFVVINDEDSQKFTENYYINNLKPMFNRKAGLTERRYRYAEVK